MQSVNGEKQKERGNSKGERAENRIKGSGIREGQKSDIRCQ